MIFLQMPGPKEVEDFLAKNQRLTFSYPEVGGTKENTRVNGYDNDQNRALLGHGEQTFDLAKAALLSWKMFPGGWAKIIATEDSIREGQTVIMSIQLFGLYWLSACRIVYLFDEKLPVRRFGFAYGTLPSHIEKGEERFSVEMLPDGSVWYDLKAFSRPRFWLARLVYPVARMFQRRFVRESKLAMQKAVENGKPNV